MGLSVLFFATIACLVALTAANKGEVTPLTAKNFKASLRQYDASLVEFYAPWCGHCKSLQPKYDDAAKKLARDHADLNVALFKSDAVEQQALASKFSIQSYPTIKLFHGFAEVEKYEGERETDAIVSYLVAESSKAKDAAPATGKNKQKKKKKKKSKGPSSGGKNTAKHQGKKTKSQQTAKPQAVAESQEDAAAKAAKAEKWREEIGRSTWHLLHSVAAKYPEDPTPDQQIAAVNMVQSLQQLYPCEKCRLHLNEKMGTSKPLVTSRKAFSSWVCMLHNLVNDDLGKEQFDCTLKNLDKVYAKDCDGCVVNGVVEDLSGNGVAFGSSDTAAAVVAPSGGLAGRQKGDCSIATANEHYWLDADTERSSADLTDGKLTIVFFFAVTCHVCHEIHPVLKVLHEEFAGRGLNIIGVHQSIYGDIEKKFESQAIDYHALEELPYPMLSHQQTATKGDGDRTALKNSLFAMTMGRDGFGVPAMAVMKDCKTVWRGMGFQLKQIEEFIRSNADKYLDPSGHAEL